MLRNDILLRKDEIVQWCNEKKSKAEIANLLHCNLKTLNTYLRKMHIDYAGRQNWAKGQSMYMNRTSFEKYVSNGGVSRHSIKVKLLRERLKEPKCECCGLSEWLGHLIPLELHHKDGDRFNNELSNLLLLCPNCHSLTDNYRGKNCKIIHYCRMCGKPVSKKGLLCKHCAGVERMKDYPTKCPSKDVLLNLIINFSFVQIGKKYGVSDKTVGKWCKKYGLPYKYADIKNLKKEICARDGMVDMADLKSVAMA